MPMISRTNLRRGSVVAAPLVIVAMLIVLGGVVGWPVWLAGLVVVVGFALGVFVIAALRAGSDADAQPRWLRYGQAGAAVLVVVASVAASITMYWRWTVADERHTREMREVADAAYTVAGLLTSMTPETRDDYLQQLRPLVTDEVAQALRDKVVVLMQAVRFTQKGVVRSVGVEAVNDGAAVAIAVVEPAPPPPPRGVDADPSNILVWLLLARFEDRWVLANVAPLGVRPGYPG
jgi:hypothetical protein